MGMHRSTTHAAGSQTSSAGDKSGGSVGHKIYMQLMNGVSHMLPLVVGGGILIAHCIPDRWIKRRLKCASGRSESKLWYHYSGSGICLKESVVQHLDLCFRSLQDLLPWQSVTDLGTCTWSGRRYDGSQTVNQVSLVL